MVAIAVNLFSILLSASITPASLDGTAVAFDAIGVLIDGGVNGELRADMSMLGIVGATDGIAGATEGTDGIVGVEIAFDATGLAG